MYSKTEGIVLHSVKYGDNGRVVTLYTEAFGRVSFLMQGLHAKKSAAKANLLQPLFLLALEMDHKQGKEIQRAKESRLLHPYQSLPYDVVKSSQAIFLAEFLYKVLREEEAQPELYRFLDHSFRIFDLLQKGSANFHLSFLLQLARYLGFAPAGSAEPATPYFDLITGTFCTEKPLHPHLLEGEESKLLSLLLSVTYEEAGAVLLSAHQRNLLTQKILDFYALHLGIRFQVKSFEVLRELFT
ncbi:MAG: DNA repair protein RecO [Marinilabiliales bacterium]|nr:DNA repair protein RecO [Marinilabiliales bacterium]